MPHVQVHAIKDVFTPSQKREVIQEVTEAMVRIDAELLERVGMLREQVLEVDPHGVAEDDRVADLHHRGLHVQREEHAGLASVRHLRGEEGDQRLLAHMRRVQHLPSQQIQRLLPAVWFSRL